MTTSNPFPQNPFAHSNFARDDDERRRIDAVIAAGPFRAEWDSLRTYTPPEWYLDAKLGIFIHWGVYSVPGVGSEWYSRTMYRPGTREWQAHQDRFGDQCEAGYAALVEEFTGEDFDPVAWASLFRRSGAQYVVPVAEHHDGFAMYDSARSTWTAAQRGPRRDVIGELGDAVREQWLTYGVSSHRAEHWFFMNTGARSGADVLKPELADFYGPAQREETSPNEQFLEDWLLRTVEVIDRYRPQVLWFDWWIEHPAFESYLRRLAAYYYNSVAAWGRSVVINYKWTAFAEGSAVYDIERGAYAGIKPFFWQNDTSVSRSSWGYTDEQDYKTLADLVVELVDVVSKNGALLMNVGPDPRGRIPQPEVELLEGVGRWLDINGEAIYGTRPWTIASEGPTRVREGSFVDGETTVQTAQDVRFTTRRHVTGDYLYATLLAWPSDGVASVRAWGYGSGLLERGVRELTVLGVDGPVTWTQHWDRLEVQLPEVRPSEVGVTLKVWLDPVTVPERHDFLH